MRRYKNLEFDDRKIIEKLIKKKEKPKKICEILGICKSSYYRELKKCKNIYNAEEAQKNTFKKDNLIDWDIIGKKFGLCTVIEFSHIIKNRSWWKCQCDCGNICFLSRKQTGDYCSEKRPLSCGCIAKQWISKDRNLPLEEASLRKYQDLMKFKKLKGRCWLWTGYRQKGKTPKTSWRNKSMSVRKCIHLLTNGLSDTTDIVYSKCGNLACFNPDHITTICPEKRSFYEYSD